MAEVEAPLPRLAVTSTAVSHAKEKRGYCHWVCGCNNSAGPP